MHVQFVGFSLALLILAAKEGKICLSTMASSSEKQSFISPSPRFLSRKRPLFWSPTFSTVPSRSWLLFLNLIPPVKLLPVTGQQMYFNGVQIRLNLKQCPSNYGPWTSSISSTWALVIDVPKHTFRIRDSGGEDQTIWMKKPSSQFPYMLKLENSSLEESSFKFSFIHSTNICWKMRLK